MSLKAEVKTDISKKINNVSVRKVEKANNRAGETDSRLEKAKG